MSRSDRGGSGTTGQICRRVRKRLRSLAPALALLALVAIWAAACTDPLPEAPDLPEQAAQPQTAQSRPEPVALRWSAQPAGQPWGLVNTASWRRADANLRAMARAIQSEAVWCIGDRAAQQLRARLQRDGEAAAFESLLNAPSPTMLEWMQVVFAETVRARDVPMTEMPQVWLIPRLDLRRWGCVLDIAPQWLSEWSELELSASDQFEQLLGWRHPELTPAVELQLYQLYFGGWYDRGDSAAGRIVIVSDNPANAQSIEILSHEIVHALQDQVMNWTLHQTLSSLPTFDEHSAYRWVIEGDAAATELTLDDDELRQLAGTIRLGEEPASAWEAMVNASRASEATHWSGLGSPYREGAELLGGLQRRHGWSMVNSMLDDPPESTEQLLHLDKFAADEQPIVLAGLAQLRARLLTPDFWQEPRTDRMGEGWLRSFIHTSARDAERASAAADGWGGDELALWRTHDEPNRTLVTWQIAWDNEAEHQEGVEGLTAWLVAHSSGEARWARGQRILGWDGTSAVVRVVDHGQSAWLVVAESADLADSITLSILNLPAQSYWRS